MPQHRRRSVAATIYLLLHLFGASATPIHNNHGLQIQDANRDLQECPPGLPSGICDVDKLKSPSGFNACVNECIAATCCQSQDGQPSCMFSCGSTCFSYMDCTNLNDVDAPFDDSTLYPTYSPSKDISDDEKAPFDNTNTPTNSPVDVGQSNPIPSSGTLQSEEDGDKLSCPPGLPDGICNLDKLQDLSGYAACARECIAATCCQPEDGEESCMTTCGGRCMLYMDCMNLSDVEAPPNFSIDGDAEDTNPPSSPADTFDTKLSKSDTLSVDYYEGFNMNFIIDQSDAEKLMPYAQFTPLKLDGTHISDQDVVLDNKKSLRGDRTIAPPSAEGYYISLYAAKIGVEINGEHHRVGRADIFTYTTDPDGRLSLLIVGCYMEIPKMLQDLGKPGIDYYKQIISDLAPDSRTNEAAYPHFLVDYFSFTDEGLVISGGDLDESIVIDVKECSASPASFTKQFVNANSIAWRSSIDKNVNYFNQDFIFAPVLAYTVDDKCGSSQQIGHLRQQLPSSAKLENIEAYGSRDDAIIWKYDDVIISEGTPYLTFEQKQDAIKLKRQVYSDMWQARSALIKDGEAETLISLVQGENSVFIIWELEEDAVANLSNQFNLDEQGIIIVPVKVVKGDPSKYIIALNVYHSKISGDLNGSAVRYEFSTFVTNKEQDDGIPCYMVFQAGSSTDTFDPVNGNEKATKASLEREGDVITLVANTLTATLNLGADSLAIDREFINANGKVYWTNGVYDEVYFDTSLIQATPKIATNQINTAEGFEWAEIINGQDPVHTFVYEDSNQYFVCPWCNMGPANPLYNAIKLPTFGAMAEYFSSLINSGQAEPSVDVTVYGNHPDLPRVNINYEIKSVKAFELFLNLPKGLSLAPMRFTDKSETSVFTLTLSVFYESFNFDYQHVTWYKAVWTTYIQGDESGQVYLNEFHVILSEIGLDVVEGFSQPAELFNVSHVPDNIVDIAIQDDGVSLNISVQQVDDNAPKIGLSDDWVDAHERVYWKKGVYDKLYINDQLSEANVSPINVDWLDIVQKTPWMNMVEDTPFEAFYFLDTVSFVTIPWANIEELV